MLTLSEFLKSRENQSIILAKIIELFREKGEWGKRGLFVTVGNSIGFSAAYIGQVLNGKKAITDEFVNKISEYLNTSVNYLRGEPWATRDGGVRTDVDVPAESVGEYENNLDEILGVRQPSTQTIQVKIQERVDELCFMAKTLLMLAGMDAFKNDEAEFEAERIEYTNFLSDLISNMELIIPVVNANNKALLESKIDEMKSVIEKLSKIKKSRS